MTLPTFKLIPTSTNVSAPFCFGHTFKQGEVPSGASVTATFPDFQCIAKNAWPDGSLKYGILSGRASVTGTTALTSQLSIGPAATGTTITTASINTTAVIDCGVFGSVSWNNTDWPTPFVTWISGPKMSSFIYRKPVGADAHLTGWLEVRVWSGGEVEVLPWIENGYLKVAAPTNKNATYAFSLAGTQRFIGSIDLKHHQRTPLVSGNLLSHWVGTDPGVTPLPDPAYMQTAELVPTYSAIMPAGAQQVAAQVSTYSPLQPGGFVYDGDAMPSSGYQSPIGLLPEHDVVYLVANAADRVAIYKSIQRNGYSAGRYGVHYRDETTNRPPTFSTYPTLVVYDDGSIKNSGASTTGSYTPPTTGGNPPAWDTAHSPSMGYMAYLLTGRFYFKEEAQFAATANHYAVTDWVRGAGDPNVRDSRATYSGASGIWTSAVQIRGGAWGFRALTQALCVTPDAGDPLKAEFKTSVEENCRFFSQIYLEQPNHPFGFIQSGETYSDLSGTQEMVAVWMHDFVTMAWGAALCMGLPISNTAATKMASYFQWRAKSVVHRFGDSTGWRFEQAAVYEYPASPSLSADYITGVGPWYGSAAAAYTAARVGYQNVTITPGTLYLDEGRYGPPSVGVWAQASAALAYAVRHNVSGASTGLTRLQTASNYSRYPTEFAIRPVWSVAPSGATTSVVATPSTGPSIAVGSGLIGGRVAVKSYTGRGITPAQVAKGFALPSFLENDIAGAASTDEFTFSIDSVPIGLTLQVFPDSSAIASGSNGVYTGTQTVYRNGVPDSGSYVITVGTFDTVDPVISGSITITALSTNGFTVNYPAATDNVGISFYELSLDGGLNYSNVGNVTSVVKTGLSSATVYSVRVRAVDTSGRRSNVLSLQTATNQVIALATTVTFAVVDYTGSPVNASGLDYAFYDQPRINAGIAPVKYGSDLSIQNGVATVNITGVTSLFPGNKGRIEWGDSAGTRRGGGPVTVT